jgi:hypothetical protein
MTDAVKIVEWLRHFSLARSGELHRNPDAAMADAAADLIEQLTRDIEIWKLKNRS